MAKYKQVYLTEKFTQVENLAPILGCKLTGKWKPAYNEEEGIAIVPLQGHVMRLLNPQEYDEAYKQWNEDTFLCFPNEFKRKPVENNIELYNNAIKHLRDTDEIIIATDFDNEGAALAMEIIDEAEVSDKVSYMLHMGSVNEEALRKALKDKPHIPYNTMANAGYARAFADWSEGMSLTRALSVKLGGGKVVLNFGGVKSPLVYMVVNRDLQFEQHKSIKYWTLSGTAEAVGKTFDINIVRKEEDISKDKNGKEKKSIKNITNFDSKDLAEEIKSKIEDTIAKVSMFTKKESKENPPKLYTQTLLQADVSKKLNIEPIKTLAIAQKMYQDTSSAILTYPRTEIEFLHDSDYDNVPSILGELKKINHSELIDRILKKNIPKRSSVFKSEKVTSHGAIIPTTNGNLVEMYNSKYSDVDKKVFDIVATRYIENFMDSYEYLNIQGEAHLFDDYYVTFSEKKPLKPGFKELTNPDIFSEIENYERIIPDLSNDDDVKVGSLSLTEGETKPKPRFTEETLLKAMGKIANLFPDDPIIKEQLGENGIGTGATRAAILTQLFKGDSPWFVKKGKQIVSTDKARKFIKVMPKEIVSPIKRALLQKKLTEIERGELDMKDFLYDVKEQLVKDIEEIKEFAKDPANIIAGTKKEVVSLGECPVCKEGHIYEGKGSFMCTKASWKNEGTKEKAKWVNSGCEYSIWKEALKKFNKATISKTEVKGLLKNGKMKVTLKSKTGNNYEKYILIDPKWGVKVDFETNIERQKKS
jgi:DNA topoisomerase-3